MKGYAVLLIIFAFAISVSGLDNGQARTPVMGWLDWEKFRCNIDCEATPDTCIAEKLFMDMADRMAADGYLDAGYNHVNIDDCWLNKAGRNANGSLEADPTRFPHGIKWLADYIHAKGLKIGIYEDLGTHTCGGYPGTTLDKITQDADTFASWGIDMLKLDGCYSDEATKNIGYPQMSRALLKTGRPFVYSCSWPAYMNVTWSDVTKNCNMWRMYDDIQNNWKSVLGIINWCADNQAMLIPNAGPGQWNDPDMLIIGDTGLNEEEAKSQMAIWSILAAPLLMSNDLRTITDNFRQILLNKEIIAVDQDPMGKQGQRVSNLNGKQIWVRPLHNGDKALVLFNTNDSAVSITASFPQIGISGSAKFRDLYEHKDVGTFAGVFSAHVQPHGVAMFRITPQ